MAPFWTSICAAKWPSRVADRLESKGIPFIVASGYNSAVIPDRFLAVPRVEKPFNPGEVIGAIPLLLQRRS